MNARDCRRLTALHVICKKGKTEIVQLLITSSKEFSIDLNTWDDEGQLLCIWLALMAEHGLQYLMSTKVKEQLRWYSEFTLFQIFTFCPKIVEFLGRKLWKCCGIVLFICWKLWKFSNFITMFKNDRKRSHLPLRAKWATLHFESTKVD